MFNLRPGVIVHIAIDGKEFTGMVYRTYPNHFTVVNIHYNNEHKGRQGTLVYVNITQQILDEHHVVLYASEKGQILYDSRKVYDDINLGNMTSL